MLLSSIQTMEFHRDDLIKIAEKASTVFERLGTGFVPCDVEENEAVINSRMKKWCQVIARGDEKQFKKRFAWDGLDLSSLKGALGSVRIADRQNLPSWTEILNEAIKTTLPVPTEETEAEVQKKARFLNPREPLPFEELFVSFVYAARQKLITLTGPGYNLLTEDTHTTLERNLLNMLTSQCVRALDAEFAGFRAGRQFIHHPSGLNIFGSFPDGDDRKLYRAFIREMLEEKLASFFAEYCVLGKLAARVTELWIDALGEFLLRLESDLADIQKTFKDNPGEVIAVEPYLSDRHNNGRSVIRLEFKSGLKLIYKPKDLALEKVFYKLQSWFNENGITLPFKVLKVLNYQTHGWVEYVEYAPCKNKEEAERYYKRAGMTLCILYVLGGSDCHHENIIACGEYPVLIDTETLSQPPVHIIDDGEIGVKAITMANEETWNSVLRTAFLPIWQMVQGGKSYDISGLGGIEKQDMSYQKRVWKNVNTDRMKFEYECVRTKPRTNIPVLKGESLLSYNYAGEIIEGFEQMYRFLMEHRENLLSVNNPLAELKNRKVRFIFRNSRVYSEILKKALCPEYLRDGADRSIQLDVLARTFIPYSTKPHFFLLFSSELKAVENLDIPIFISCSDNDDLLIPHGQTVKHYFAGASYDSIVSLIKTLNDEDMKKQSAFIRASLSSRSVTGMHNVQGQENSCFNLDEVSSLSREDFVKQAIAIAEDLRKRAICSTDGSATWIAPAYMVSSHRFQLLPMGYGLYDGCCGIALFLAALEKVTGEAKFRGLALASLEPLHRGLQDAWIKRFIRDIGIGGAIGGGSIIYSLVRTGQFLDKPAFSEDAEKIASFITPESISADKKFDVMFGSAGAILGLLALYDAVCDRQVLKQAVNCGNHLLSSRIVSDSGYRVWKTLNGKPLTGFSHGTAGIAYALLRLYQVTGETAFMEAAREGIAYERSVFIPEAGNWPDFRLPRIKESYRCGCSWCHGAPGIGLARIAGIDILNTEEIQQDIDDAIGTTMNSKFGEIDHLCCGNLGKAEFLLSAGQKLCKPELLEKTLKLASFVASRAGDRGTFGLGQNGIYMPGFFQGTAGIGYELLRLNCPDLLPSVLSWE